jgi:HSP20 family protein
MARPRANLLIPDPANAPRRQWRPLHGGRGDNPAIEDACTAGFRVAVTEQGAEPKGGRAMTVIRFDPFQEFDRFSRQMLGTGRGPRSMPMEAYRRGDQFFIHLDLPGVAPDDVQLTVERNVVAVRAERRPLWRQGDDVLVDETPQGIFSRQLFLGENLDAGGLEATFDQGILTLTIPVAEQAKPRRIEVSSRSQGPTQVETSDAGQGSTAGQRPGGGGGGA